MNPLPEEVIGSLQVECSAFGLTLRLPSGAKIYSHTERPVPKKPKDLARCEMMNGSLYRVIKNNLRNPNPNHRFFLIYRILRSVIEQKTKTAV